MNKFKPGDKVMRTGPTHQRVIKGDTYEVARVLSDTSITLKGLFDSSGIPCLYNSENFELAGTPKDEVQRAWDMFIDTVSRIDGVDAELTGRVIYHHPETVLLSYSRGKSDAD